MNGVFNIKDAGLDSDFLIIGAGVVGLACAQALCQRGARVTIVERGLCGGESSWAGGGILSMLRPWDYSDEVARLALRGAARFPSWAEELHRSTGVDPEYEKSGMLVLPPFDKAVADRWCASHRVRLSADANGGLLLPDVAQVRNPRLLHALRARVEALGGRIVERCAVGEIVASAGRVKKLETTCGEFTADGYIVTAGAWSREVLGPHALNLDIVPMRGQMLLFKFDAPPLAHIVLKESLYLIPRRDGHLLVGSTMENVGFDKSTTTEARDDLSRRAQAILPSLRGMPLVRHWAGLRPGSPGNIPAIGRHPQLDNLYINSGHFRYGVTMASASAEIMLNEIEGAAQPFDVTPYRTGWGV
jgi:glycine oxidase